MTARQLHDYTDAQMPVYRSSLSHWRAMIAEHGVSRMTEKYSDMLFSVCNHIERDALKDALNERGWTTCG
jgi:hypothetical protein